MGFLVACALASPAGAATARLHVTAKPGLFPTFATGTHDYAVRCKPPAPVRLSLSAPKGTTVAVGDATPRSGSFETSVALRGGRGVVLHVRTSGRTRDYGIRCLPGDFPAWEVDRRATPQARYYVLALEPAEKQGPGYAAVFDDHGVPVWWKRRDPTPFNAMVVPDGGIAWTQLSRDSFPASSGRFDEYALDGRRTHTYTTKGGADLHELRVLPNGHAFVESWVTRFHQDLSPWGGPADAAVFEGRVEELDAHGATAWRWSTHGHVGLGETKPWYHRLLKEQKPVATAHGDVYDVQHLNSLDPFGDKLVLSLRNTNGVYEIDRDTGRILWKLGGTRTSKSLKIVGDKLDPTLDGQHDVRVLDAGRRLTVYDNGIQEKRLPRALEFRIDAAKRTATLTNAVEFPPAGLSRCCGGARRLPGGNWAVSWGNTPYVTELTAAGKPVLVLRFPGRRTYRVDPVLDGTFTRAKLRAGMDRMAR